MISTKKCLGLMVFTMVAMLFFISGCTTKTVLKEDGMPKESVAVASQPGATGLEKTTLSSAAAAKKRAEEEKVAKEAALNAQEKAKKEAARSASAKKSSLNVTQKAFEMIDIHFDFDDSALRNEARELLKKHAEWLNNTRDAKIVIEGNCDERGTAEYNLALGQRRADTAAKYLINLGIDAKRIKTVSYGFELPVDPQHNEEAWAKNRRDHFVVSKK